MGDFDHKTKNGCRVWLHWFHRCQNIHLKSINLQYNTLGRLDNGTNEWSTKRLMFQVLFFFYDILQNSLKKLFSIYFLIFFYKITWIRIKSFECPKSIKSLKKIILGTSGAWSTIHLSNRPSAQRSILYCRLSDFKGRF